MTLDKLLTALYPDPDSMLARHLMRDQLSRRCSQRREMRPRIRSEGVGTANHGAAGRKWATSVVHNHHRGAERENPK